MLNEIVCELADTELCRANGKTLEDMCDTDGAFLEEYQELFNRIYDELEMRITDYMNGQSKNVTMKAKVFKYKSDGNTVVASYMELEPYAKNVYLSLSRKNEYGNEDDDCFHVVCRIETFIFQRAVFTPVSQGRRLQRGSRHLLQELDCGYASKCGKRSLRQFDLRPRVRGSRT